MHRSLPAVIVTQGSHDLQSSILLDPLGTDHGTLKELKQITGFPVRGKALKVM
jgi:hypothetical protein